VLILIHPYLAEIPGFGNGRITEGAEILVGDHKMTPVGSS